MLLAVVVCSAMTLAPRLVAEPDPAAATGDTKESATKVRLALLPSLLEDDKLVLASPGKDGKWTEYGESTARPSFITEWFEAHFGEMHLTRRTPDGLVSKGRLDVPSGARSVFAVIAADPVSQSYRSKVTDPSQHGFTRGSGLLMNLSKQRALVTLGKTRLTDEAGVTQVSEATPDANCMYWMLAGYKDADKKWIGCYDPYVSSDPKSREFLFPLPDEALGLRVPTLPEFGDDDRPGLSTSRSCWFFPDSRSRAAIRQLSVVPGICAVSIACIGINGESASIQRPARRQTPNRARRGGRDDSIVQK